MYEIMSSNANMTILELIDYYGFKPYEMIIFQYGMPGIGIAGFLFAALSCWIFFDTKSFHHSFYDYFKLISLLNTAHLLIYIPHGLCLTPRYFPEMDSHACITFVVVYNVFSNFFFHYTGVIEFAIVLDRLKNFNNFVKQHFTLSPRKTCLYLFIICVLINVFFVFVYEPKFAGIYYFTASNGHLRPNSFYLLGASDMAQTLAGFIVVLCLYLIRDILTFIIGVTLNVILLLQIKSFFIQRTIHFNMNHFDTMNLPPSNSTDTLRLSKKRERHMSQMVFTFCLISCSSRMTLVACNAAFIMRHDHLSVTVAMVSDLVIIVSPCVSFFVFYKFNKVFRNTFLNAFGRFKTSCFTLN